MCVRRGWARARTVPCISFALLRAEGRLSGPRFRKLMDSRKRLAKKLPWRLRESHRCSAGRDLGGSGRGMGLFTFSGGMMWWAVVGGDGRRRAQLLLLRWKWSGGCAERRPVVYQSASQPSHRLAIGMSLLPFTPAKRALSRPLRYRLPWNPPQAAVGGGRKGFTWALACGLLSPPKRVRGRDRGPSGQPEMAETGQPRRCNLAVTSL